MGETDKALALLTNVIDHSPSGAIQPYILEQRASDYEALGFNNEAILDLTSALRTVLPNERTPLLFKRAMLYQKVGRHQEAEDDFGRALRNSDRRDILRMQVYLRNHGYTEVVINGAADPSL